MTLSERALGRVFKDELEGNRYRIFDRFERKEYSTKYKVYLNKPVPLYTQKFGKHWLSNGFSLSEVPPSQPEVDIILVDSLGIMRAVELKFIRKTRKGIKPSYYFGLGQTLAYLSFGFDQVAIWQCFDGESLTDEEIDSYNYAFGKIREPVKDFICGTYFRIKRSPEKVKIQTRVFFRDGTREWKDGIGIYDQNTGEYKITWDSMNPFLHPFQRQDGIFSFDNRVGLQVRAIHDYLKAQKNSLWDI